jgi:hypothetical protein
MKVNGSMILKLLEAEPGRYILHDRDAGIYRLKKAMLRPEKGKCILFICPRR